MKEHAQSGQALVTLMVFVAVGLLITTAAITVSISSAQATTSLAQGQVASQLAETGAENSILQLLRNPSYAGEIQTLTDGSVVTTLSGTPSARVINGEAQVGNNRRKLTVGTRWDTTNLSVISWQKLQ